MNIFKKIILKLRLKLKIEKTIKLRKCTPAGKPSSNNGNMGTNQFWFVITSTFECNKHFINHASSSDCAGWIYDYEIDSLITIEELEAEKEIAKASVEALQTKIDWLIETGNTEFNEDEFKVYATLKLLEKTDITITEKSKLIAGLIKGSSCK